MRAPGRSSCVSRHEGRWAGSRAGNTKDTQGWLFYWLKSARVTDKAEVSTPASTCLSVTPSWRHWIWQEQVHRKQRGCWGPVCLAYLWEVQVLTPCQQVSQDLNTAGKTEVQRNTCQLSFAWSVPDHVLNNKADTKVEPLLLIVRKCTSKCFCECFCEFF